MPAYGGKYQGTDAEYKSYLKKINENYVNRLVASGQRKAEHGNPFAEEDTGRKGPIAQQPPGPLAQMADLGPLGPLPTTPFASVQMGQAERLVFDDSGHIRNSPLLEDGSHFLRATNAASPLLEDGSHFLRATNAVPTVPAASVAPESFTRTAPMGAIPPMPKLDFSGTGTVPKMPFNPQYSPNYRPAPTPSARQGYGTGEGVVQRPFNPQYSPNWSGAPLPESVLARQYQNPNAARSAVAVSPTVPTSSTSAGALADRTAGLKQAKEGMFFGNPTSGRVGYTTAALLKANSEVMAGGDLAAVVKRLAGNPYMGTVPDALMKALTGVQTARGETYASQLFKKLYRQNADGTWTLVAPVPGSGYPGYPGRTYRPAWGYGGGYGGGGGGSQQSRMIQWKIRIE